MRSSGTRIVSAKAGMGSLAPYNNISQGMRSTEPSFNAIPRLSPFIWNFHKSFKLGTLMGMAGIVNILTAVSLFCEML